MLKDAALKLGVNMYGLIRIAFSVALLVLVHVILYVKKVKLKKSFYIISVVVTVVLIQILFLIPFENMVYSFPTAEKAYCYYYGNKEDDIVFSLEGRGSEMVIARKAGKDSMGIMSKESEKWKIGYATQLRVLADEMCGNALVKVYKHVPSGDIYIRIMPINISELKLEDNFGTEFVTCYSGYENSFPVYYGYVEEYSDGYELSVNGEKYEIDIRK